MDYKLVFSFEFYDAPYWWPVISTRVDPAQGASLREQNIFWFAVAWLHAGFSISAWKIKTQ